MSTVWLKATTCLKFVLFRSRNQEISHFFYWYSGKGRQHIHDIEQSKYAEPKVENEYIYRAMFKHLIWIQSASTGKLCNKIVTGQQFSTKTNGKVTKDSR